MQTPSQLRDRLLELGIARDLRTLTDWREKGILPPLERASRGRGRGVERYWSDDVLDQAIGADWLIKRCGRADETLFGLWLAGFPIDHAAAKRAWIEHLKRVQHRREQAALRHSGGFPGLGRSWWKRLKSDVAFALPWWKELREIDREGIANLLGDTQEWLRDDENRDDESYRNAIAELVIGLTQSDRRSFYRWFDHLWREIDPKSLLAIAPYIELVQSMSLDELDAAQESLVGVSNMLCHAAQLLGSADRVNAVVIPVMLMRNFVGTLLVRIVIKVGRAAPEIPLEQSISILYYLVMRVQYTDITKETDGCIVFSERIRAEWEATKKKLSELWEPALESDN